MTSDGSSGAAAMGATVSEQHRNRVRRFGEVILFVGSWMALGRILRLDADLYLLLGIPLTWVFQWLVARQPLTALWVRDAQRLRLDGKGMALAVGLAIVPIWLLVRQVRAGRWDAAAWAGACLGGAVFAAFAIRQAHGPIFRPLLTGLTTAGIAGSALMVLSTLIRLGGASFLLARPAVLLSIFAQRLFLFFPACFVVEEVTFRGALDSHVHPAREERGAWSALLVSTLWGLWHLPITSSSAPWLARAVSLIVVHLVIGVPLSLVWRRSGNLVVPAFAHAVIDAIRDALMIGVR
jgi:membrane protease YdiL (CAAX protease family)